MMREWIARRLEQMNKVRAFFIDKDGTIVDTSGCSGIISRDNLSYDDIIEGLQLIHNKGYKIFVVSNQPWIARKMLSIPETEEIFQNIVRALQEKGISIEKYVYCPHNNEDLCKCKKPNTQLVDTLIKEYNIDKEHSFVVGDMDSDILLGQRIGTKTVLVRTGRGKDFEGCVSPDFVIDNINDIGKVFEEEIERFSLKPID